MVEFPTFTAKSLWEEDGTWQSFRDDWEKQCEEAGEPFEEYAPDVTEVLRKVAAGEAEQTKINNSSICGIQGEDGRYWAVALLNWVRALPGEDVPTLRIRHLLVSPRLDFGLEDVDVYADVLIGALSGFLTVAEAHYEVREVKMHLRSPADVAFFRVLGSGLAKSSKFERVETRGAWLYITLSEGDGEGETQPEG